MKLFGKWLKESPASGEQPLIAAAAPGAALDDISPANSHAGIGKGRKVLVVDDNAVVVKTFELKLKSCGFEVITAGEGSVAVSTARQARPDLILLDIHFPTTGRSSGLQWDGFNIMQWLGRFQEAASIPVIVITSGDPEKLKPRALAAGAVAFFQKPVKFDEFLAAIDRVLAGKGVLAKPV